MWFLPTPVSSLYNILVPKYGLSRLFNVDKIFTHFIQIVIIYSLPYYTHVTQYGEIFNYMHVIFFHAIAIYGD